MTRLLGLAVVSLALTFAACGSSEKKDAPAPEAAPQMSDAEALIGTWSDGSNSIMFGADKSYRWETAVPCGAPPCPKKTETGTWQLRSGALYLAPDGATDEKLGHAIAWNPRTLDLTSNKRGKSWRLNYAN